MKGPIQEIIEGFRSLITGMRITIEQFFKPSVTVHYPHESLKMSDRFRGHIELARDPETGKSLCIACKSCEKAREPWSARLAPGSATAGRCG